MIVKFPYGVTREVEYEFSCVEEDGMFMWTAVRIARGSEYKTWSPDKESGFESLKEKVRIATINGNRDEDDELRFEIEGYIDVVDGQNVFQWNNSKTLSAEEFMSLLARHSGCDMKIRVR